MPLPSGVTGATLVAKVTKVTSSSPVAVSVSIEPSVDLTHTASGTKLSAMIETLVSGSGQASKILVPYSAQAGFVDSTGAAVSRWYYTATVSYTTASGARAFAPQSKTFILPVGSGGDLENLPAYSPPARTSTAAVELPDRLSNEALASTYGPTAAPMKAAFAPPGVAQTLAGALPNFTKALRDYNDANPSPIRVITLGSSVMVGASVESNTLAMRLNTKLQETFNRTGMRDIVVTNGGVNGSTVASATAATTGDYALAKTAAGGDPKLVVLGYGMNEGGFAQYHTGLTYPGVYSTFRRLIALCKKDGADVIVMTTPHPNPDNYPWGYTGTTSYPKNAGGTGVIVPAPDRTSSTIVGDWSRTGVNVEAHYRYLRVNESMRQAAIDGGAVVVDAEKYWFEAVAKHGVAALYNGAEYVHPNLLGHQESYWRGLDDLFSSLTGSKIQSTVVSDPGPVDFRAIGERYLSMSNGQVYVLTLPADTAGELTLYGTAGGGWQSITTCKVVTRSNRAGVSALQTANASTSANIIASVSASTTSTDVTVTTATTGTSGIFTWVYRYLPTN